MKRRPCDHAQPHNEERAVTLQLRTFASCMDFLDSKVFNPLLPYDLSLHNLLMVRNQRMGDEWIPGTPGHSQKS